MSEVKDKLITAESLKYVNDSLMSELDNVLLKTQQALLPAEQKNVMENLAAHKYVYTLDETMLETIPSGADLDEYTAPGVYGITWNDVAENISNLPLAGHAGRLIVLCTVATHADFLKQIFYPHNVPYVYERVKNSSTEAWSDWVKPMYSDEIHKYQHITLSFSRLVNCTGTVTETPVLWTNGSEFIVTGRLVVSNFARTAANPEVHFTTTYHPEATVLGQSPIRFDGPNARCEKTTCYLDPTTTGSTFRVVTASETFFPPGSGGAETVAWLFETLRLIRIS